MAQFALADNVKETTTTTGTGTVSLLGAFAASFKTFVNGIGNGKLTAYKIDDGAGNWECRYGVITSGSPDTISNAGFIASSTGLAVSFGSGTKTVTCVPMSELFITAAISPVLAETSIASATTTDLGSIQTLRALITGTTTITGFGTSPNSMRIVRFNGILTLTYNASSLITITAANRTTAVGDIGWYISDGSGNWTEIAYSKAGAASAVVPNYLTGGTLSTAGSSATFSIAPFTATDSTNVDTLTSASTLSKTTSAWTVGAGGGLDVGSIANNTWYYPYGIKRTDTGIVDALVSMAPGTSATVTMTIASPGVITWTGHGLQVNAPVKFSTTGALPTGLVAGTQYFVKVVVDVNSFQVSATQGGVVINTSGTQSGTHTATSYPVMPTSYTEFRRLGAMKTNGSAQWAKFFQWGDWFVFDVMVQDAAGTFSSAAAVLLTLSTPPGLNCLANIWVQFDVGASNEAIVLTSPDVTDTAISGSMKSFTVSATAVRQGGQIQLMTNTSAQIRAKAQVGAATYNFNTIGWFDTRGK